MTLFGLPGWTVALVIAGLAPFAASAFGKLVERRVRDRTRRSLAGAGLAPVSPSRSRGAAAAGGPDELVS
ncbi:MAG: hypothetical protein JWP97_4816 [Labilithrix sp.]|nr:hypothetical protein [Labilithrix sp.]